MYKIESDRLLLFWWKNPHTVWSKHRRQECIKLYSYQTVLKQELYRLRKIIWKRRQNNASNCI